MRILCLFGLKILDAVADLLTYGALAKCPTCNMGQLQLRKNGFACNGNISEWAKCDYASTTPVRSTCVIPSWLDKHFVDRQNIVQDRLFKVTEAETDASTNVKIGDVWQ